jgi:hypothetical protein
MDEDKEDTTTIRADDASPVVEGEPPVEMIPEVGMTPEVGMIPDGEEILRAIHSDTAAEQQSTLAASEDPNSNVETLKFFDALTDIKDIDISELPVVYAYEVGNEESKRLALQKQNEYYEKLEKQRASFLGSTTQKKRGRPSAPPATTSTTTETHTEAKKPRTSVTAKLENARGKVSIDTSITKTTPSKAVTKRRDSESPRKTSIASGVKYPICEPAPEDFLAGREGWIRETHNRKNNPKHFDKYWFTPKTKKKLRSVPEVKRFLELLDLVNGDEDAAFAQLSRK